MIRTLLSVVVLMAAGVSAAARQQAAVPAPAAFDGYWIGVGHIGVKELRIGVEITSASEGRRVIRVAGQRRARTTRIEYRHRRPACIRRPHSGQLRGRLTDRATTGRRVAAVGL